MKKAIIAAVFTSFVTTMAFASIDLRQEQQTPQKDLITSLQLDTKQQKQVQEILQNSQKEKSKIMADAQEKFRQLELQQQQQLQEALGSQAELVINTLEANNPLLNRKSKTH